MEIDKSAPLVARREIIIGSPVDHVWQIQSDINNWPSWQKEISEARLEGELQKGTIFRWKVMGLNITSKLQEVIPNKSIGWTGDSIGMHAMHKWELESVDGKTRVVTEESLSGWLPWVIKLFKPHFLEESLTKALETLKLHAEHTRHTD